MARRSKKCKDFDIAQPCLIDCLIDCLQQPFEFFSIVDRN
jgi:hypothetical protein